MSERKQLGSASGTRVVPADRVPTIADRAWRHGLTCEVSLPVPVGRVDKTRFHPEGLPLRVRVYRI